MTRPGERNQQISLQYKTVTKDTAGNITETWHTAERGIVWAKITTRQTDEAVQAMAQTGAAIHNVNIVYRTDVRPEWRIKYGTRYFAIVGIPIDVKFEHKELDIKCKEAKG